jgi:SP family arabinose:H+ symporter-like MFS transporter
MNRFVILISAVAALGGLLFGFDTAVISGTINFIQPYFGLSEAELGWTVSSLLFGCLAGVLIAGRASEIAGRKKTLMLAALLFFISAIGSSLSGTLTIFVLSRVIGGVAVGIASIVSPMYIAEVSPASKRGLLVSLNQMAIVVGILLAFFTNYLLIDTGENNWRWMLVVMSLPAVFLFFSLLLVPESPRWLVARNKNADALTVLSKTIGAEEAAIELEIIRQSLTNQKKASFREVLSPGVKPILFIGIGLAVFQQITGINTILYYAPKIFSGIGISNDSALLQTVAVGATNMIFTIVAMSFIDRLGRKPLLMIGSAGMMLTMAGLSLLFLIGKTSGPLVLLFILGYCAFFAASLGPVTWVLISELFPNRIRSIGMAISVMFLWSSCILVTVSFPVLLEKLNGGFTFLIFSVVCLADFLFIWRNVPETKGKTLENIEMDLTNNQV